jgi:hypothetical protein
MVMGSRAVAMWAGGCSALLLAACASDTAERGAMVPLVRDSAGVRIVEHPRSDPAARWAVDEAVRVSLGGASVDAAEEFQSVRAVLLLDEGDLLVIDGASSELRRFGADGALRWRFGRRGNGPGEFVAPMLLGVRADGTIALWDRSHARRTVVSATGELVGTESIDVIEGHRPVAYHELDDRSLVAVFPTSISAPAAGTVLGDTIGTWHVAPTDRARRLIVRITGTRWLWTGQSQLPVPFTSNPLRAVFADRIAIIGSEPVVHWYARDGRLLEAWRVARPAAPVLRADVDAEIAWDTAQRFPSGSIEEWSAWRDQLPLPDVQPTWDAALVADDGELWLQQFAPRSRWSTLRTWDRFAADGTWRGVVEVPARFVLMSVRDDHVAGVWLDGDDVEHVQVRAIGAIPPR